MWVVASSEALLRAALRGHLQHSCCGHLCPQRDGDEWRQRMVLPAHRALSPRLPVELARSVQTAPCYSFWSEPL
jgi:hypothetical protein